MIARHEAQVEKADLWSALAAPLPAGAVSWRQDGRAVEREGRWVARFVAYVDANTVRERLDAVVPGEWDLTLDLLPPLVAHDDEQGGVTPTPQASFKARLQILGVIREDVGTGRDYKAAATDAFKRAAVRFGIGHELYAMEPNWVRVDGDGRYAKPLEDPQAAYDRRLVRRANGAGPAVAAAPVSDRPAPVMVAAEPSLDALPASAVAATLDPEQVACPKCGGRTWDNRLTKRNPKAPDFKCRDRSCDGVIWPPRGANSASEPAVAEPVEPPADPQPKRKRGRAADAAVVAEPVTFDTSPLGVSADDDDLPF
jgi:hypothetical protein